MSISYWIINIVQLLASVVLAVAACLIAYHVSKLRRPDYRMPSQPMIPQFGPPTGPPQGPPAGMPQGPPTGPFTGTAPPSQ